MSSARTTSRVTALAPHTVHPSSDVFATPRRALRPPLPRRRRDARHEGRRRRRPDLGLQDRPHRRSRAAATGDHGGDDRPLGGLPPRRGPVGRRGGPGAAKIASPRRPTPAGPGSRRGAGSTLAKLGVVLDELVDEYWSSTPWPCAAGSRCRRPLGISPCVLLSEMNERGIPTACEVDVGNAVTMRALSLRLRRSRRAWTGTTTTARPRTEVHPVPLRPRAAEHDDGARRGHRPRHPGQRRGSEGAPMAATRVG